MNPSIFLLLISLLFSFAAPMSSTALSFSVNITLSRDASIADNSITLTHPTPGSVGQALYSRPIRFLAPTAHSHASFSSRFTFSITPSPAAIGDGLAFLITSVPGTPSGYLGLFHDQNHVVDKIINNTFAVEFDHHISLDIGTNLSAASANPRDAGIDLRAGIPLTAWVEYSSREKAVRVWLGYSRFRSTAHLLRANVDLSGFFHEFMHVGFSASSGQGGGGALHVIRHWNFHVFGLPPVAAGAAGSGSSPSSPAPAPSPPRNSKNHQGLAFLVAGVLVAVAILCCAAMAWWCRAPGSMTTDVTGSQVWRREPPANGARLRLPLDEIKLATSGFHTSKLIGQNTTETAVYAGVLRGRRVAVKRFFRVERFTRALSAELSAASRVRHRNMVALTGWCCERNELVLVYEFIPNGSLDSAIHRGGTAAAADVLTWERRWRILLGVASALDHLHRDCEKRIIHRAVTSRNVLIDRGFNGRLGDLTAADDTGGSGGGGTPLVLTSTDPMASPLGYLAPEYLHTGVATDMSDVYGFGVVALEVATGRRPINRGVALVDWVWGMLARGRLIGAADPKLRGGFVRDEMVKVLTVGLCCVHPDSRERPSMKRVVRMLEGSRPLPELPEMKPAITLISHVPPEYSTTDTDNTTALVHSTPAC